MQIYWIVALAFGIVIALFAVQNSMPIPIRFLWLAIEDVPISVLVLVCATLGALVTFLFGLGREVRMRMAGRSARRRVRSQEEQIADLQATVQKLERDKAELQGTLDGVRGTGPYIDQAETESLPPARERRSLPPGESLYPADPAP